MVTSGGVGGLEYGGVVLTPHLKLHTPHPTLYTPYPSTPLPLSLFIPIIRPSRMNDDKVEKVTEENAADRSVLSKAYEPGTVEDGIYSAWEDSGFFNPDNLPGERKEPFVIMIPPPNATGTLHIGHAMFLTLEDLMIRFHRMRGKAALWVPGTDHAAIATNTKVEKLLAKEGKTKYDLGRGGFIERVKEYIAQSQGTIRRQIRKMGSSCDWSREAYTFDDVRSQAVREVFVRMYNDGLIYRGTRIVNWCPRCESTLADDEVEYKEEEAKLYYMKYGPFVVATTRPETKLGDTAVAVNPHDKRYKDRIGEIFTVDFGIGPQEIRVIGDDGVDMEFGTGVVGVTPAHSITDFEMAERNNLPVKKVIGEDGKITAAAGKYAGMPAQEARAAFAADLEAQGLILKTEDLPHKISICYRCDAVIEPMTSRQWFVAVGKKVPGRGRTLKQMSLDVVEGGDIEIIPERFSKVYSHWMKNLHDWCISRQIWFGHRIPVWYCKSCYADESALEHAGHHHPETGGHMGINVSAEPPAVCKDCGRDTLVRDPDTLDTWFSSGTWTFSALGWPDDPKGDLSRFHPTQVLETGYDILFFWIARMVLMTTYALGEIPFEKVYLHGLVRDDQGRKMSKSLENMIDPLDVAGRFGTDAVRLSLIIGNTPGNDLRISEDKIEHFRNFTNKLWNIARFVQMTAGDVRKPKGRPEPKTAADRWILGRLDEVARSVTDDMEGFGFSRAGETLRDFTWGELADWYLEAAKIEGGKEGMLAYILYGVLKLWHPFMPFVTEEIYRKMFSENDSDFLMVAEWPQCTQGKDASREFEVIKETVVAIRNIRATYRIEPGRRIDAVLYGGDMTPVLEGNKDVILGFAKVENLTVAESGERPEKSSGRVAGGVQVHVPLGGIIDIDKEKDRIGKGLEETRRYVDSLQKKIGNEEFTNRAPEHVVEAEREKLREHCARFEQLKEQLKDLE